VSEEDADSESVSMDEKSLRLLKRPLVWMKLQSTFIMKKNIPNMSDGFKILQYDESE